MTLTATYDPADNKLRLYSDAKLTKDLYERVKGAGFKWAPKQELFVAPMWTPEREDVLLELCGRVQIGSTGALYCLLAPGTPDASDAWDQLAADAYRAALEQWEADQAQDETPPEAFDGIPF